jgi:glycosyltransferase involved in cell wall biosynthesis
MSRHPGRKGNDAARHILVVASTFPASDVDPVPAFVKELVVATAVADPRLRFSVLAPHDPLAGPPGLTRHEHYDEYRFRYGWPARTQRLAGRGGIVPSLQANRWLYLQVPFFLIAEFFALIRLTRRLRPDVVNAHWIIPQGVVAAMARAFLRVPIVLTVHGGDVFTFNNALTVALKRRAMRAAARVVVNSSVTLARAREISADGDYEVVPMGVNLRDFESAERTRVDALRILYVGRLSEEKGVSDLIAALALLRERGVAFEARIVGTGPQAASLAAQSAEAGLEDAVRFAGWVARESLGEFYAWADVFVGPSIQSRTGWIEALGVVFIEAAAAGLPVITTDTGGMRDVVLDGATGFIVNQKSPDQIAARLAQLGDEPLLGAALGAAGKRHVTENFAWSAIATRYAALFESV